MRVIVAGSRSLCTPRARVCVEAWLNHILISNPKGPKARSEEIVIISGCARGPDSIAIRWAQGLGLQVIRMPADWSTFGRSAGIKRNLQMLDIADGVIAFWDGQSSGTRHMIESARRTGRRLAVVRTDLEGGWGFEPSPSSAQPNPPEEAS